MCTNNSRHFSQPWNVGLLKFNTRKLASKGECLIITEFLRNAISPYLQPRLQSLATTSCGCRPLLLFPKASCYEALILQSVGALQDCRQMSRDWLWENQEFLVNWSWIIKIGHFCCCSGRKCLKFACMWAPSLPHQKIQQPCGRITIQYFLIAGFQYTIKLLMTLVLQQPC